MVDVDLDLLKKIVEAHGISGFEEDVMRIVRDELQDVTDEVSVSLSGNVFGIKKGKKGGKRVMLLAHMDEIGFLVKCLEDSGYIRFEKVGYIHENVLPGTRVRVKTEQGELKGVIGVRPAHLGLITGKPVEVPKWMDMYIDVGAGSLEELGEMGVEVGNPICFDTGLERIGTSNQYVGKALDDRACVAAMIQVMRLLEDTDCEATVCAIATVEEEIGLRGAGVATHDFEPDIVLAMDGAIDSGPDVEFREAPVKVGKGPAIKIMDHCRDAALGSISHPKVVKMLKETARNRNIPYQLEVITWGCTDAAKAQWSKGGIPTGTVSLPMKYLHSPSEVLDLKDMQECIDLIVGFCLSATSDVSLARI